MVNNHDDDSMLRVPNNSKDAIEYILNSKDIDTILGKTSSTRRTNFRRLALLVHPDKCKDDDRATDAFRRLVDIMEKEGEDNDDDNKEEVYTTWRWWEASTFEERERLWSNLEEAFTREMRMARDKDEERRRLRIERKRQHAQAERAAVDTTDPYFKAAAKAEVNSFDRRTAGWRAFNRKKRKKNCR
ncbi:J domain-containing protein spf31, putative [Perkinsus marinus ATCC 50983]|uniref:J domain-containing protein spf31, putative n=1 Tax=Perkinsus marinus (strain ATCC 50983 / TXsc) TaxID=423536 RepID=C5KL00_PERM5|nr:J domain-containing protein spf31, putative [Perkinsus marinus ATCC 50983]EER14843.1 J domain-containing protein spf31, putative [Perkinsus marinus ATCC 50983]|eukprot:XP_002783047.1 J domain-containing protein spf31, putative [Perkinsus marinus ATCC 50983]